MPLPPVEIEFTGRFPQENLTSGHAELHFRFGADAELLADLLGNGHLAALTDFHILEYDQEVILCQKDRQITAFVECNRKVPNALSGGVEGGIGQRSGDAGDTDFANSTRALGRVFIGYSRVNSG